MLCGPCAMSADPRLAALEGGWDGGTGWEREDPSHPSAGTRLAPATVPLHLETEKRALAEGGRGGGSLPVLRAEALA